MRRILGHQLLIVVVAAVVYFTALGGTRLWDRDETRNARCTVEMLERGDWVVPYYNGQVRDIKPAFMYWFMMSATEVFGRTEFAFRFWSAIAGIGTCLLSYHIGRRLFNTQVGLWTALILATSLMFAVISRTAKVDALLVFFTTAALFVFVHGVFRRRDGGDSIRTPAPLRFEGHFYPQSNWMVFVMFALMGVGVLAKGPVGLILPAAVVGMFLLIKRMPSEATADEGNATIKRLVEPSLSGGLASRAATGLWVLICLAITKMSIEFGVVAFSVLAFHLFRRRLPVFQPFAPDHFLKTCWYMRPVPAALAALAVALPWHVWVAMRDFSWVEGFYLVNNLGRATNAMEGHGGSSLLYYPISVAAGFFPWSVLAAPVLIGLVRRIRNNDPWRDSYILAACWVGVFMGVFSLAQTKLPNYVLAAYPALAMLTGCYIYHLQRGVVKSAPWWPKVAVTVLGSAGVVIVVGLVVAVQHFLPGEHWLVAIGLIPLAGGIVCFALLHKEQVQLLGPALLVVAVAADLAAFVGVAPRVDRHQRIEALLDETHQRSERPELASYIVIEPSWVFYGKQNIRQFGADELEAAQDFLAEGDGDRFLITTAEQYKTLRQGLPANVATITSAPELLSDANLVLIGRVQPEDVIASGRTTGEHLR